MPRKSNDPNHPDNNGPIQDDGTLIGYYLERQRRSRIRNPERSAGDTPSKKKDKDQK